MKLWFLIRSTATLLFRPMEYSQKLCQFLLVYSSDVRIRIIKIEKNGNPLRLAAKLWILYLEWCKKCSMFETWSEHHFQVRKDELSVAKNKPPDPIGYTYFSAHLNYIAKIENFHPIGKKTTRIRIVSKPLELKSQYLLQRFDKNSHEYGPLSLIATLQ